MAMRRATRKNAAQKPGKRLDLVTGELISRALFQKWPSQEPIAEFQAGSIGKRGRFSILSLIFGNFQSVIESEMGFYFHSGSGAWPLLGQGLAWLDECGVEVADDNFFGGDIEEEEFWGRGLGRRVGC